MTTTSATMGVDRLLRIHFSVLAVLVVLALFPYTANPAGDIKILLYTWGGCIAAITLSISLWRGRDLKRPRIFFGVLLTLLSLFLLAGLASSHRGNSLAETNKFVALFLLYVAASQVYHTPEQVDRLMVPVCIAVALAVAYGFAQRAGWDPFPWDKSGLEDFFREMPSTFGHGNFAAHAVILSIVMSCYLAVAHRQSRWCAALLPLYLAHMHFSNQRGGIVAILAALTLLFTVKMAYSRIRRPLPAIAAGFVVSVFLGLLVMGAATLILKVRTGVAYPIGQPILVRYHAYSGAVKLIQERPFLGFGPGNYVIENPRYWTPLEKEHYVIENIMNLHVHNDILEIGTEAGLAAAGLYLCFLIMGMVHGLLMWLTDPDPARRRFGGAFAAFFCAFMVDGFFGFNLRVPVSAVFLFLMVGAFEGVWSRNERSNVPKRNLRGLAALWAGPMLALLVIMFQTNIFVSEILFQRGKEAMQRQAYTDAERLFRKGETLAPWNWRFAFHRGNVSIRQNSLEAGLIHFRRALSANPGSLPTATALARTKLNLAIAGVPKRITSPEKISQWRLKTLDEAEAAAQKALAICNRLPQAEDTLGRVASFRALLLQNRAALNGENASQEIATAWKEAEGHFLRAIEYRGKYLSDLYCLLARVRVQLGDEAGALASFLQAANASPMDEALWPALCDFAKRIDRPEVIRSCVLAAADRLAKEKENIPVTLQALALNWNSKREGSAIIDATQVLAEGAGQDSKNRTDATWAGDLLLEELERVELPKPQRSIALYNLGVVYSAAEAWEKAQALFSASSAHLPEASQADGALNWAMALNETDRHSEAVAVLRKALENGHTTLMIRIMLARTLAESGKTAAARLEYMFILRQHALNSRDRQAIQHELDAL